MKVLIIDDNEDLASTVQEIVEENKNFRTRTSMDGDDGYLAYLDFRPDLVITDIHMPGKNGFELIKNIRMHNPNIRTIYMSSELSWFRSLLAEEKKRHNAGFLKKPFSRVELMRLLSENLG